MCESVCKCACTHIHTHVHASVSARYDNERGNFLQEPFQVHGGRQRESVGVSHPALGFISVPVLISISPTVFVLGRGVFCS